MSGIYLVTSKCTDVAISNKTAYHGRTITFMYAMITQMFVSQKIYSRYDNLTRYDALESISISQLNYDFPSHAF